MNIAIVVVAYNRTESLGRLVNSIKRCSYGSNKIDLVLSIDKSTSDDVVNYANTIRWDHGNLYKEYKTANMGLRKHILSCGDYFEKYHEDVLIILEDDLYITENAINYIKACTEKYFNVNEIAGISLYAMSRSLHTDLPFIPLKSKYDVYFMQYAQSWGQVWFKNQWTEFKTWYDNNIDYNFQSSNIPYNVKAWPNSSWLKYHIAYCVENNKYFVYPYISLTTNFAEAGVHYKNKTNKMQVPLQFGLKTDYSLPDFEEIDAVRYDVFQENMDICSFVNLKKDELCVNLFGLKECNGYRYILTRRLLNYKIVHSYDLSLIPHERNVIDEIPGEMIFLYDTSIPTKNYIKNNIHVQANTWDYYFSSPNITKFRVFSIYVTKMYALVFTILKSRLKKRKKELVPLK